MTTPNFFKDIAIKELEGFLVAFNNKIKQNNRKINHIGPSYQICQFSVFQSVSGVIHKLFGLWEELVLF